MRKDVGEKILPNRMIVGEGVISAEKRKTFVNTTELLTANTLILMRITRFA